MPTWLKFVALLAVSNTFMTIAWYGHLRDRRRPLVLAILISWLIALVEYVFQVPANRIGAGRFSLTQLKIAQECISLTVFLAYAFLAFREVPRWNTLLAMALIVVAVALSFLDR